MLAAAHINSGSVFCSSEAIFESLPRDLLVDQLLEALLVILRDFYNLHFNESSIRMTSVLWPVGKAKIPNPMMRRRRETSVLQ